ncbi:MAG: GAF domain-containing protein, partial [Deltaproteobacteria bacterium]|nr:GAF domain-containing protein [Deltaproteobacteria bacterium]
MGKQKTGFSGTDGPSRQKDKKTSMEMHQMDIQRALSISLAATDTLMEGLNLCLEASLQISGMDCGGIYLFDNDFRNLNLIVHKGLSKKFVNETSTYGKDSENVLLIEKGEPIYTLGMNLGIPLSKIEQREGLRAVASLPLSNKSKVIGCINVASRVFDDISLSSRIALETIAAQAGNVIARLQATQALQESEEHLSSLMLNAEHYAVYRLKIHDSEPHGLKVVFVSPSI